MHPIPRRTRAAIAMAAFALLLPAAVVAGPVSSHFDPVIDELNDREADLPTTGQTKEERKQARALKKSFKAIEKDSDGLADDLKMAKKVVGAVDSGFPGDGTLDGLLDDLIGGLAGDVDDAHAALEASVEGLEDGKPRTKAAGRLTRAGDFLEDVDAEPVRKKQAALLLKALKQIDKGTRAAAKGGAAPPEGDSFASMQVDGAAWATNDDFGPGVSGLVSVSEESGNVRELRLVLRRILPKGGTSGGIAGASETLRITLVGPSTDIALGTYAIGNNDGVALSAVWIVEDEEGEADTYVAVSGSLTLTDLVALLGSGSAGGTFGFSVRNATSQTLPLSSGAFEATNLQRFSVD